MKICIYGVGAIGGLIAYRIADSGYNVSVVARGQTLANIKKNGIGLCVNGRTSYCPVFASDSAEEIGKQDVIIIAVKGNHIPGIIDDISELLSQNSIVVTAINGVPWWFFDFVMPPYNYLSIDAIDPGKMLSNQIKSENIVGNVAYPNCERLSPGVSKLVFGNKMALGSSNANNREILEVIAEIYSNARFEVHATDSIHEVIWSKVLGNSVMNPVSALTGSTLDKILADPELYEYCGNVMREVLEVGQTLGYCKNTTVQDKLKETMIMGSFKTSMLQDVEAKRMVEVDALLASVCEIAEKINISTPFSNSLLGLTRVYARQKGLY